MKKLFLTTALGLMMVFPALGAEGESFDDILKDDDVLPRCTFKCPGGRSECNITCPVGKSANCGDVSTNPYVCVASCTCR